MKIEQVDAQMEFPTNTMFEPEKGGLVKFVTPLEPGPTRNEGQLYEGTVCADDRGFTVIEEGLGIEVLEKRVS